MRRTRLALVVALSSLGLLAACVPDPVPGGGTTTTTTTTTAPVDPDRLFDAFFFLDDYFGLTSDQPAIDCIAHGLARHLSDDILGPEGELRRPGDWLPADDDAFIGVVNACIPREHAVQWMKEIGYFGGVIDDAELPCAFGRTLDLFGGPGGYLHFRDSWPIDREQVGQMFESWIGCVGTSTAERFVAELVLDMDWRWAGFRECIAERYVTAHGADLTMQLIADLARLAATPVPSPELFVELEGHYYSCGGW